MLRFVSVVVFTLVLAAPGAATAGSVSIDVDVFSAPDGVFNLCWLRPRRSSKRDLKRLAKALEIAARNTQPAHVDSRLIRIRSRRRDAPVENCRAVLDVTAKGRRRKRRFVLDIYELGEAAPLRSETVGPVHAGRVDAAPFEGAFLKIWKAVSPPPPPPPEVEPDEESYVDTEIAVERDRLAPPPPEKVAYRPVFSVGLVSGLFMRSIDDRLGAPQRGAPLLSLGGDASLHLAPLLGMDEQDFDVDARYRRQLASAERAGVIYGVDADRFGADLKYRYHLPGPYLPRFGARGGFERLRFEVADEAGALSVRYSVLRGGAVVEQPLFVAETFALMMGLDGGVRWSPGTEDVATLGWDAGAGVLAAFDVGAFVRVRAHLIEQRGGDVKFRDRFFDTELTVGWSL